MSPSLFFGVPDAAPRFLGRDEMVERMVARLASATSLTLAMVGPGGVGKTTLAAALAHHPRVRARFGDGVLWAGLGTSPDPAGALNAWAGALGLTVTGLPSLEDRAATLRAAIGYRRMLLVVDDVWDEDAAWLLQCGGPLCSYLFTTRGEDIARRLAGSRGVEAIPVLDGDASLALLARWAPRACADDPAAARELAGAVRGLPLALEVLGGYLASGGDAGPRLRRAAERLANPWPAAPGTSLLDDALAALRRVAGALWEPPAPDPRVAGPGDAEPSPLETVVRLSLGDLSRDLALAFYELGAFAPKPETFDEAAAVSVTGFGTPELELLAARGLVERMGADAFTLHPAVADVARVGMPADAPARHRLHYVLHVRAAAGDWRAVERVYGQVKWAWDRLEPHQEKERLLLARTMSEYQRLRGLGAEAVAWGEAAARVSPPLAGTAEHAGALFGLAWAYYDLELADRALETYRRCLEMHQRAGRHKDVAAVLNNMGMVHSRLGEWEAALECLERSRAFRAPDDPAAMAITLSNIAGIHERLGRRREALEEYRRILPLMEADRDRNNLGITLNNVALLHANLGHPDQALEHYSRAVSILEEGGDQANLALTLYNLGVLYLDDLGDPEAALERFGRALSIRERTRDYRGCVRVLWRMASAYREIGDAEKEAECLRRAQPLLRELREHVGASLDHEEWREDE